MFRLLSGLFDRILAVLGAFLFSQAPLFIQQYTHRLAGHVTELNMQIEQIRKAASLSNKSLEQFIKKFLVNPDIDFIRQGEIMQGMVTRSETLSANYQALLNAGILEKPFLFLKYLDVDIAKAALNSFEMGIVFTVEGLAYGFLGMIFGVLAYKALVKAAGFIGYIGSIRARSSQ